MGPVLNSLIKLQDIENRLREAKAQLARCRRSVIIEENQVRSLQNALEVKKEEVQLTKLQCDRLELDLKTRDEEINKLRAALNASKTNKEYAALLTQLNTTKADNSKLETQALELMKDLEATEAECNNLREEIERRKKQLDETRTKAEKEAKKHQIKIEEIQNDWDQLAQTIPPEPLNIFKRVAETYDGQAVAVVEQQEGRTATYSCGGCFMNIAAEFVNLLMTKDDIIRCPNCTRIIVLGNVGAED
jgi:predicted  nucleic acid-binding Zn-ribbon protein